MQKILIVEDDEGISRMLEATLQTAKYQCCLLYTSRCV